MTKKSRLTPSKPAHLTLPAPIKNTLAKPSVPNALSVSDAHSPRSTHSLPAEAVGQNTTVALLALMIFVTPAVGVPHEQLLQDTLKSMVVCFVAVFAGLLFAYHQLRAQRGHAGLRWHALLWLPLGLMVYALGSMAWSHTYLAGVEAIRWFVFSLLLWLGLNTLSRERTPWLIGAVHWGAVVASVWATLQFWFDFGYFPQGPNPASTFVNRNFFAEFVVCTLPFSAYLLAQARVSSRVALMAFSLGFNTVALLMTGTRGALMGLWLCALVLLPAIAVLYRRQFAFFGWSRSLRVLGLGTLLVTIGVLGSISTGNATLRADAPLYGNTAFERALGRTASISPNDASLNVRFVMWQATARMISTNPLAGVGAGAWEAAAPLYQSDGAQLETDYYAHNEPLQLLAEYGLVGLLFLLALAAYLLRAAWSTVRNRTPHGLAEAPLRAVVLTSLLVFMLVSNIGFTWRLAATGALFALSLALLAASDARLKNCGCLGAARMNWLPIHAHALVWFMGGCLVLTAYISQQAIEAEQKIVAAVKIALTISALGDVNSPKWDAQKSRMLDYTRQAIAINPHYRKITPMVADELGRWGDWADAVWVWESVVGSRPHVVAILANIARGYSQLGNNSKAFEYLARAEKLQPRATLVQTLKVVIYSRAGREAQALALTKSYMATGTYDADMLDAAYVLGLRVRDFDAVLTSLALKQKSFPAQGVDTLMKLGGAYSLKGDDANALASYRAAVAAAPIDTQASLRQKIPAAYLSRL